MDFNTLGYISYLPIVGFITLYVGKICHTHGLIYVKQAITDEPTAIAVNNMLLIGYYLVNIGYAVMALTQWEYITCYEELVSEVATQTSYIILILAVLHYFNIFTLFLIRKNKYQHKN
ncbi:MAG: hypothetical protein ACPGRC_00060 [Salibacteraceae bacterium]